MVVIPNIIPTRNIICYHKKRQNSKESCSGRAKKAEQNLIQTSNIFDILNDGGGEMKTVSLYKTTIKV